ncbi:MAG: Uma2 family endonuclease [Gloeomargarita sp. SKYBB_i_bin120]|nr:Uma2 family endonuclease [Gloeomargarita sp. SKYB120]MDW8178910.1 Uma2 family endonuclease [Gloeomargarita sp. SKYBB_i_bin120]
MPYDPERVISYIETREPAAETYAHQYAMFVTWEVLRQYLANQPACVLANRFLYYARGLPRLRVLPDVMVILGVTPGERDSYQTWEEGRAPTVIFEMTSAQTLAADQGDKKDLYEAMEIPEYWLFDPRGECLNPPLVGYQLIGDDYHIISDNISHVLQLRLVPNGPLIDFYRLDSGEKLLTPAELAQERQRHLALLEKLHAQGINPDTL